MPVRSCSGSGPGSTRNTCGTGMHSMPLVGWRAIITPKSCGLRKNNEQAHAGISDRGSAADGGGTGRVRRSEEHTSELQSQSNLVCPPLLEKKKVDDSPT